MLRRVSKSAWSGSRLNRVQPQWENQDFLNRSSTSRNSQDDMHVFCSEVYRLSAGVRLLDTALPMRTLANPGHVRVMRAVPARFMTLLSCMLLAVLYAQPALGQHTQQIMIRSDPGVCTVAQWKKDWPGCRYEDGVSERHLSVVTAEDDKAYRVDYVVGEIGPEKGGVGWRYPITRSHSVELKYRLTFSRDFDWVKGGKLPGLCGGPESVTGGNPANGRNGFSARLMWRADGRGEAYVYHMNQPRKYGESFPFPAEYRFPTGEPVLVRMRVTMNTPGRRDGQLDVWIGNEESGEYRRVVRRSDLEWRASTDLAVDSLLFETFYGGGDKTWAPRRPSFALFREISIRSLK